MTTTITCDALDQRLADYLEGELGADERRRLEAHLATCPRCAALLADLDSIRGEARALPALTPPRDLWTGIAARIEAPVVSMDDPRHRVAAPRRAPRSVHVRWFAAAAALMLTTAGVTYLVTAHQLRQSSPIVAARPTAAQPAARSPQPAVTATEVTIATPAAPDSAADTARAERPSGDGRAAMAEPSVRTVRNTRGRTAEPAAVTYDREITRLERVIRERRSELDPATVAIVEHNLGVIDKAIAESRAALVRDPASGFLHDQLDKALDKKVELLRTAALLPARS